MTKTKRKPDKPRRDFPLGAASNGQWCKKIKGRIHYFGVWSNPAAAETEYLRVKEYLQAGRLPPAAANTGILMSDLCNRFLNSKRALRDTGELSGRTFVDYHAACADVLDHFGKERLVEDIGPDDFESYRAKASKGRGLHSIAKTVTVTKMLFKFAYDSELIEKPIRFGQQFARPTKKSMRIHRARKQNSHGLRMFEAAEITALLKVATVPMKAMILLAANSGLGNSDLANLPKSAIQGDWLVFARVKTGVNRRIPLWPETKKALRDAIEHRPRAKSSADDGLCFITQMGRRWVRTGPNGTSVMDLVSDAFTKLLKKLELKREGLGFYALRHGFETIAGGCGDQIAVDSLMGHVIDDMGSNYRERIEDSRLQAVTDHVHSWLFPSAAEE
tara:strand:+ start:1679 stop:2845 length:1167 start_codon:yes stop_codon:yes gene_type:complete